MAYTQLPLDTDHTSLLTRAVERIKQRTAGRWVLDTASLDAALLEEFVRLQRETRVVAIARTDAELDRFGSQQVAIARGAATPATIEATITVANTNGHTIPAGTLAAFATGDGTFTAFTTIADSVVDADETTVEVTMQAVLAGVHANGLGPGTMTLVQAPAVVAGIVADSVASGGTDAETTEAYLSRLTDEFELMSPRAIRPDDFARLARRIDGVHRAVALDGYDPDTDTHDNARTVWVGIVDADGHVPSGGVTATVDAYLQAERETNFVVRVGPPTYTPLAVAFTVTVLTGYDPAVVVANATLAAAIYLSPGRWAGGDEEPPAWRDDRTVRYLELAARIDAADGVDHVTALTLDGGTADVQLDGPAGLPAPLDADTPTVITGIAA
ncbi:baseplate J/gp47 family protein [Euzebya rosea]|uniref:baseplate J/gp47 family protein n=1 Tax=Euzebya rosea TaxID=2052804 RepID=UPI000D3E278D|nr:baseplate J/gp47 family protein [Euzebya rosea]